MITTFLIYTLKVSCCIALFYIMYHFLFRGKGYFQLNRFYLLYTTLLSFALPLMHYPFITQLDIGETSLMEQVFLPLHAESHLAWETIATPMWVQTPVIHVTIGDLVGACYLIGVGFFTFMLIRRLHKIYRIIRESQMRTVSDQAILEHPEMPTSSFFQFMFWRDTTKPEEDSILLRHELVHAKQWHSLDTILLELCTIVLWFNPLLHVIRKELQLIHEYIADQSVVNYFGRRSQYAEILTRTLSLASPDRLVSPFNSSLKQRIQMLRKDNSRLIELIPYFLTIPMIVFMVVLFSNWVGDRNNLHPKIEQKLRLLEKKLVLSINRHEETSANLVMKWDDQIFKASVVTSDQIEQNGAMQKQISFQYRGELTQPDLLELLDKNFELELMGYNFQRGDYLGVDASENADRPEGHLQFDLGDQKPLELSENLRAFLRSPRKNTRLTFHGSIDGHFFSIIFRILNHKNKKQYLRWKDEQFDVGFFNRIPIQLVDADQMIQLAKRNPRLYIDGQEQTRMIQPTTFLLKGPAQMIEFYLLPKLLDAQGEIEHPIAIKMQADDGRPYFSIFADEERPTVTYNTWDEVALEPIEITQVNIEVKEKPWKIHWGPLKCSRAPTTMERATPFNFPMNTYVGTRLQRRGNTLTLTEAKEVLSGKLDMSMGDKMFSQITMYVKHITPQGVPRLYQLTYRNGRVVEKVKMEELIRNLQPRHFLDIFSIKPQGQKKDIHFYFRIDP